MIPIRTLTDFDVDMECSHVHQVGRYMDAYLYGESPPEVSFTDMLRAVYRAGLSKGAELASAEVRS